MTDSIIAKAQSFYAELNANNSKDWWQANRGTYDETLKPFALNLLKELAPKLAEVTDAPVTTKLFRPHRDVRFSKDKTPYQTHLHMMWGQTSDGPQAPVFFFGIGLDYVSAGAGMMGFDKPVLENWRKFCDLDHERIIGIVSTLEAKGFALREPQLKRVPPPFAKDHPAADLLRRKGLIASKDLGAPADVAAALFDAFKELNTLNALLLQIAEA